MKSIYISALKAGDEVVNEPFLLHDVVHRTTRDNRPFLLFTLRDKTGQLSGVFWDVPNYIKQWTQPGLVVLATGKINHYKDALQLNATDLNPSESADLRHFLPSSGRSREELLEDLLQKIDRLAEPWQGLVSHLLLDDQFLAHFADAPAARVLHHAYIGGLLEHSLSMATLAEQLADHYPYVNRDLLVTGALLHDMGKVSEYTTESSFGVSEDGRLVGHIIRAIVMVEKAAVELDFPQESLRHLVHLIASHHGTLEFGSPTVPKTLEAILLHQIDLLDSRVQGFFDHISSYDSDAEWTVKSSNMFGTELRRPSGFKNNQ